MATAGCRGEEKKRPSMKILLVSDYSPKILGGAQIIVGQLRDAGIEAGHEIVSLTYADEPKSLKFKSRYLQFIRELINPFGLIKIIYYQLVYRPEVIWYHTINNEWSWSVLPINLFRSKRIITLHDLSPISRMKLTPENLSTLNAIVPRHTKLRGLRNAIIRFQLKQVATIGIGEQCSKILREHQVKLESIIPNRIPSCQHIDSDSKIVNSVLFAGRENLKGLAEIARAVNLSADWKLFLAGDKILNDFALSYCPEEKIVWLGKLSHTELLAKIHSMDLVAVCSQYYDNFPTVALEAIVHGSIPITTEITGVSEIVREISPALVFKVGDTPSLALIREFLDSKPKVPRRIIESITGVDYQFNQYLQFFY